MLIIEDVPADVVLINHELRKGGLSFRSKRIVTREEFMHEVRNGPPDLILSDHGLPQFDGFTALAIAQNECPQVPFLFVTGSMGEEVAIESLKSGATDYVLKNRLTGLVPAVMRALRLADERKRRWDAEQALSVSEEHFRMLVEGVKDYAIFMLDAGGKVATWNTGAEWIIGYPENEILGRSYASFFPPEDIANQWPAKHLRLAETEGRCEKEGWRLRKGGARFLANVVLTALRRAGSGGRPGRLTGYAVVTRDITERRQAEDRLRQSEARKGAILEAALDGIIMINAQGTVTEWNQAAEKIFGFTREQAVGSEMAELIVPAAYREAHRQGLARYLQTGQGTMLGRRVEVTARRANGTEFPVELALASTPTLSTPTFIGYVRDLTERDQARAALAESEARHSAILEAALDAIIALDHEGVVQDWNAAAERMFGYTTAEARGRRLDELIIPSDLLEIYREGLAQYLIIGAGSLIGRPIELAARHANGREFAIELGITPVPTVTPPLYTAIIRDVAARKEAEAEIRRLNTRLEERVRDRTAELETANQELESFSFSVSHDLRAPLRHIAGFAEMLQAHAEGKLDDDAQRLLQSIRDSAGKMTGLIDALLAFSRLGRAELHKAPLPLAGVIKAARHEVAGEAAGRAVEWVVGEIPEVEGDPALLQQVLVNLFSNALKYSRPRQPARIEVGARREPGRVVCFVRDNGVGFDMRYADKLFGVFQRLHRNAEFEGTGIGLANVRLIIQRHGGRVWAESKPGEGATFYFSLPVAKKEAP